MKLYLAVAMLLLAFATQSEAQDDNTGSIAERFNQFGETVTELGQNLAEKTKATVERFQGSEFAINTRNWFEERVQMLKKQLGQ